MDIQNMSVKSKTELLSLIDQIPVLPTAFLSHYVCQLYYTLNDELITVNDIKLQENPMSQSKEKEEDFTASEHSSYYYETLLSQSVQDGIPFSNFSNQISSAQVGTMCPGDPLRQKKDEGIGLVTIFTRAAIQGGISFEKAYTCSDYYIQSIEAASNITEVIQLIETMYFDITNQVHEATLSAIKNPMIRECITYLDTHYREKIKLEELANTLGYTKYYLSTCFKKETGVSISEYIMEKRIAYAKLMLKNPSIDMQEISDELCFSNPSHFSAVFKKMTGLTPTQYRNE
nr:AraC family transcriptional regulator [uncultured Mediterraneibacter sp.]